MSFLIRKSTGPRSGARRSFGTGILPLFVIGSIGWLADLPVRDTPLSTVGTGYVAPQQRETLYAHGQVNVRAGAGQSHAIVRTLARGERVEVEAADANGWAPAYVSGARVGYVYRASTRLRAGPPTSRGERREGREPQTARGNPSGATARCRDGTLSYSAHRRGTCSHHGGVAVWF
ncbi:MAG TPA: DUF3761 domain-containing protein [Longimicrobium sp.]